MALFLLMLTVVEFIQTPLLISIQTAQAQKQSNEASQQYAAQGDTTPVNTVPDSQSNNTTDTAAVNSITPESQIPPILLTQPLPQESTPAIPSKPLEHWGIVAILVDEDLLQNTKNYEGLTTQYQSLTQQTLPERIQRYALDVQQSQEYTRTVIVPIPKGTKVEDIANMLEKLYFEGTATLQSSHQESGLGFGGLFGGDSGGVSQLRGVVIVGDVPLPVVTKQNQSFVSMFPYTDFVDKAYIFNPATQQYELNNSSGIQQPEVWHGVIKPPSTGEQSSEDLAIFFDKNHLYHCKDPADPNNKTSCGYDAKDFQQFTKKLWYMDLVSEAKMMDKVGFKDYLNFIKNNEDVTYQRYNKHFLQRLLNEQEKLLSVGDNKDNDGDGKIDEDPVNGFDDDGDGEAGSPLQGIADGIDNDGDGLIDEPDEGRFGLCDILPFKSNKIKDCSIPGVPLMTGNFYNVKPGSKYKVTDDIDNNNDGRIDEGIDEDDGDAFVGIDNDRDGLVDEDTTQDNDKDKDGRVDEDPPGDKNKDGCPGECGVDEDLDSYDFDTDLYPNGYEKEIGNVVNIADPPYTANIPNPPDIPLSPPLDFTKGVPLLRTMPPPISSFWVDEGSPKDDDEDGQVDEDGTVDNDNDGDGKTDEDSGTTVPPSDTISMPDAATRPLIDKLLPHFNQLFDKYFANINDWATSTGRYRSSYNVDLGNDQYQASDVATTPGYIAMKDDDTRFYLKSVNDAVEAKIDQFAENKTSFAIPQLEKPVAMLDKSTIQVNVTFKDDSTAEGNAVEFMNMGDTNMYGIGGVTVNGTPGIFMQSAVECSLFRGSKTFAGDDGVVAEGNHLYDYFNSDDSDAYAGCNLNNSTLPDRCFPNLAEIGLFTLRGTREIKGVPPSATTYQACYDFKEINRYNQFRDEVKKFFEDLKKYDNEEARKQEVVKPGPEHLPTGQTELFSNGDVKITLADILAHWGAVDGIDNNNDGVIDDDAEGDPANSFGIPVGDRGRIGEEVLKGGVLPWPFNLPATATYTFKGDPSWPENIKEVTLLVQPEATPGMNGQPLLLSSFVPHKEPTAKTLEVNSNLAQPPMSMPTDDIRFFTFQDQKGKLRRVQYPDLFSAKNYDEAFSMLQAKEQELTKIAQDSGTFLNFEGSLTPLLDSPIELYENPRSKQGLLATTKPRLNDALAWNDMNIDQKHEYVIKTYLDPTHTAYIGEISPGYESLYMVAKGGADQIVMGFNTDVPDTDEDPALTKARQEEKKSGDGNVGKAQSASTDASAGGQDNGILTVNDAIPLPQWFGAIQEWLQKTTQQSSDIKMQSMCGVDDQSKDENQNTVNKPSWLQNKNGSENTVSVQQNLNIENTVGSAAALQVRRMNQAETSLSGAPDLINITPSSSIIRSNGLSTIQLHVQIFDNKKLLVNRQLTTVTLTVQGPGTLDESLDERPDSEGVQVSTTSGEFQIPLHATTESGEITVNASYQPESDGIDTVTTDTALPSDQTPSDQALQSDGSAAPAPSVPTPPPAITAQTAIAARNDIAVRFKDENNVLLPADSTTTGHLEVEVVDGEGKPVTTFKGNIEVSIDDPELVTLVSLPSTPIVNATAPVLVKTTTKAGSTTIRAAVTGFDPAFTTITTQPKKAQHLEVKSSQKTFNADPEQSIEITAELYDNAHNLVTLDNETKVTFELTQGSLLFASFDTAVEQNADGSTIAVQAEKGVAKAILHGKDLSGPINIVVTAQDLTSASVSLNAEKTISAESFRTVTPQVLFASLLGGDFGNVTKEGYLGGWFLFSHKGNTISKTQAAISLVSEPLAYQTLVKVAPTGGLQVLDGERINVRLGKTMRAAVSLILTNTQTHRDIAKLLIQPKIQSKAVIIPKDPDQNVTFGDLTPDTIAVRATIQSDNYELKALDDGVHILKNGNQVLEVANNGELKFLDPTFSTTLPTDEDEISSRFLHLIVKDNGVEMAEIIYVMAVDNDVEVLPELAGGSEMPERTPVLSSLTPFGPDSLNPGIALGGVSLQPLVIGDTIKVKTAFSGNSTSLPKGVVLVDTEQVLPQNQLPGFSSASLEKAGDVPGSAAGVGFTGDNKNMLLLAAGNSVGEANLSYASEIGIVLGDPTVRLNNLNNQLANTGYTKDLGQEVFSSDQDITSLLPIDYNHDGLQDLLIAHSDGTVHLLQNNKSFPKFEDKGVFLSFPSGLLSMVAMDIDGDGWQDIVIASADSCRQGEVCIDAYFNQGGNFVRKNLPLQPFTAKNRVTSLATADLNNDGFTDLVTADDTGTIRAFYNQKGTFTSYGQFIGSLGLHIDKDKNLKQEVLVHYDGQKISDQADPLTLGVENVKNGEKGGPAPYVPLNFDNTLQVESQKKAEDLTEPTMIVAHDDTVQYTITLKNSSNKAINNVVIADAIPSNVLFEKNTLACVDCPQPVQMDTTGQSLYPYLFSLGNIPAGASRTLVYHVTVEQTPQVRLTVGNNLSSDLPADQYPDIAASPANNPTGRMTYFYSNGLDEKTRQISYESHVTPPPAEDPKPQPNENTKYNEWLAKLKIDDNKNGLPDEIEKIIEEESKKNASNSEKSPDPQKIADDAESTIAQFTCSGGCIPMPINFAFLVPGTINVAGSPAGFDPGLPTFGWGVPSLIPVWPPSPYQGAMGGRIYMSPTLTANLATAVCLGPYLAGQCYAFKIANLIPAELCQEITGSIEGAIASATSYIQSQTNEGAISMNGSAGGGTGSAIEGARHVDGGFEGDTSLGTYEYKATGQTNLTIPGFPAVLTNWMDRQTEEIVNKLTDLPDIYFLYPKGSSIAGAFKPQQTSPGSDSQSSSQSGKSTDFPTAQKWTNVRQVLSYINSIPLIQIQSKDVLIKIPALTDAEIERFKANAQSWIIDERNEVNRVMALWCGADYQINEQWDWIKQPTSESQYQSLCQKLLIDIKPTIKAVQQNMEILDQYAQLPRRILAWRDLTSKYLYQVICYLDTIVQYTGGYIQKQQGRIEAWIAMIAQIKETINNWKALVDLVIDYQQSCDKCSTARFTLMELILKIFVVLPTPPIIPFPKLPDLYIDFSEVHTGLVILWPNIRFRPEPMILPQLPTIRLPDVPSLDFKLNIPAIPILPPPPDLPALPDLPPLPLPTLPDIPPPPKVPEFPASLKSAVSILQKIVRILCLLRQGLIPVNETMLKTQVEQLTERPLAPLIPLDLGLNIQLPPITYDYVDRIQIKGILNFQMNFDSINTFVQDLADKVNGAVTDFVSGEKNAINNVNQNLQEDTSKISAPPPSVEPTTIDLNKLGSMLPGSTQTNIARLPTGGPSGNISDSDLKTLGIINPTLGDTANGFVNLYADLERDAEKYRRIEAEYKDMHLKVTEEYIQHDDPRLQRSLQDVKNSMTAEVPAELSYQKNITAMRNALIAYADQENNVYQQLDPNTDLQNAGALLAQAPELTAFLPNQNTDTNNMVAEQESSLVADASPFGTYGSAYNQTQQYLENIELKAFGGKVTSEVKGRIKRVADVHVADAPTTPGMETQLVANKGIFILNQEQKTSERLLNYIDEADRASQLAFVDIDNDGDNDIFFSYGGNLYLKNNVELKANQTYWTQAPQTMVLNDLLPDAPAVNGLATNYKNNRSLEMSWLPAKTGNIAGYELEYVKAPDAYEQNIGHKHYRVGMTLSPQMVLEDVSGEVWHKDNQLTAVSSGMALADNDTIMTGNGTATVRFGDGSYLRILPQQELLLRTLDTPAHPSIKLIIPNGFYYARLTSFDTLGQHSTASPVALMAPSICADHQGPLVNAGASERSVAIFKRLVVDASRSADGQGQVVSYWLDTNLAVDDDGDGDPTNDKNVGHDTNIRIDSNGDGDPANDLDDPIFVLGPYEDLLPRKIKVNVEDEAGNVSGQQVTITIYVPAIELAASTAYEGAIRGTLTPTESEIPVSVLRNREGVISKITTPTANPQGKYLSDEKGEINVEDLNKEDILQILDAKGNVVGNINPQSGQIVLLDSTYSIEVVPAERPLLPTRIMVKDPQGKVIVTLFVVGDLNSDVTLDPTELPYNDGTVAIFHGTHIKDLEPADTFQFNILPADDAYAPGAAEIIDTAKNERVALLDSGGNFYTLDERIGLRLRPAATLQDPLIIQIIDHSAGDQPLGELYVTIPKGKDIQIVSESTFKPFTQKDTTKGPLYDSDKDGMPDQWELRYGLNPDDPSDAQQDADKDGLTNLEEYQALSNPLEADTDKDGYSDAEELINGQSPTQKAGSPFADVDQTNPYYSSIVDLSERHIIEGFKENNQLYFKPSNPITRAEFSKIMLDMFCIIPRPEAYEPPPTFYDIPYQAKDLPWYYPVTKEASFQGFVQGYKGEIDPVTGQTPFRPGNIITRAEAAKVILEALAQEGFINIGQVAIPAPGEGNWYDNYLKIALDLTPYLQQGQNLKTLYVITPEEATKADDPLTRAEFIAMADRVLSAYNCRNTDDDHDGMSSYWERKYGLNPLDPSDAAKDLDGDGLSNVDEYRHGTDPRNPDTDGGGVKDGVEVKKATNPLDPSDDPLDSDGDGLTDKAEINTFKTDPHKADTDGGGVSDGQEVLINNTNPLAASDDHDRDQDGLSDIDEETIYKTNPDDPDTDHGGVKDGDEVHRGTDPLNKADDLIDPRSDLDQGAYLIQSECLQCPCPASIAHAADLIPGDLVFAIISNNDDSQIFSKSNVIKIIPKP